MTEFIRHLQTAPASERQSRSTSPAPYAGPAASVSREDSAIPSARLYIPAPFRGQPVASPTAEPAGQYQTSSASIDAMALPLTDGGEVLENLPWISEFLSVSETVASITAPESDKQEIEKSAQARVEEEVQQTAQLSDELWAMDAASDQLRSVAAAFIEPAASTQESAEPSDEISTWSEDSWMDILPLKHDTHSPSDDAQLHRHETDASNAAAAEILEAIAQRVRSGELAPTGYQPSMGDAAALAATLTALLGRGR